MASNIMNYTVDDSIFYPEAAKTLAKMVMDIYILIKEHIENSS